MVLTMIFTIIIGVPFGIVSAVFRNSPVDYLVRTTAILGLSVPNFWMARSSSSCLSRSGAIRRRSGV